VDIWVLLLCGFAISILLPRWWSYEAPLAGVVHSVGLMVLAFLIGSVCSSTGVVFTPYLANCPKTYTSAHTAGAGLSGLAVALLALLADSGAATPRLSIDRYFAVLSAVFVCSIASFAYVSRAVRGAGAGYEPLGAGGVHAGSEKKSGHGYGALGSTTTTTTTHGGARAAVVPGEEEDDEEDLEDGPGHARHRVRVISPQPVTAAAPPAAASTSKVGTRSSSSPVWQHWPVFTLQFLLSALAYGIVPSVLPLACAGYADPSRVLMLATVGFMCADPLGKLATSFLPTGRIFLCGLLTTGLASLLLYCAAQSATPPFAARPWGGMVPVAANTLFSLSFSFTSVAVFFNRRRQDEEERERRSSPDEAYAWFAWSAFIIQTGAVCGTMGMAAVAALGFM
jgi:hypothetical protein